MIERTLANAIAGRPNPARYAVEGVNVRGEAFRIASYRTRFDADDYAAEIRSKGGTAKVTRL